MDTAGLKKKINQKYDAVFAGLILVLILAGILALCLGRYWIPFPDVVTVSYTHLTLPTKRIV